MGGRKGCGGSASAWQLLEELLPFFIFGRFVFVSNLCETWRKAPSRRVRESGAKGKKKSSSEGCTYR